LIVLSGQSPDHHDDDDDDDDGDDDDDDEDHEKGRLSPNEKAFGGFCCQEEAESRTEIDQMAPSSMQQAFIGF